MATVVRARLRAALVDARRARDRAFVATLRSALGALENAEAVPGAADRVPTSSAHIAGARAGLGAGEVPRRQLDSAEEVRIVDREIADLRAAARQYAEVGHGGHADTALRCAAELSVLVHHSEDGEAS